MSRTSAGRRAAAGTGAAVALAMWLVPSSWASPASTGVAVAGAGPIHPIGVAASADPNYALLFDGSNDLVNLAPGPIGGPTSVTVEAWTRLDVSGKLHVLVTDAESDFNDGFTLFISAADHVTLVVASSVYTKASATGTTSLEVGRWYHVAGVFDAGAGMLRVFVNGVEDGSRAYAGTIGYRSGRDLYLGAQHKSFMRRARMLQGALDEVRVWDRARSAEEIQAQMEYELSGDEPGLIGYWPMAEGDGTTTSDHAAADATGNVGSLVGPPQWIEAPWRKVREQIVAIDVKPGDDENVIPLQSRGRIPVAILSSAEFDAVQQVDPSSLTFGATGEEQSLHRRGYGTPNCGSQDVNADGLQDLVCQFETQKTDLEPGEVMAVLKGTTRDAEALRGEEGVRAFRRGKNAGH